MGILAAALTLACPHAMSGCSPTRARRWPRCLSRLIAAQRAEQAAARGVPLGYLAQVPASGGREQRRPKAVLPAAPGLVEQLTARELEVLALLAAGMSNPRIAGELVLTLDTVNKHVSHLLAKLGAANRTEAVTRARQLGLGHSVSPQPG